MAKSRLINKEELKTLFKVYDNIIETDTICVYISNDNFKRFHIWGDCIKYDTEANDINVLLNNEIIAVFDFDIINSVIIYI